jgi:hypothetical protein
VSGRNLGREEKRRTKEGGEEREKERERERERELKVASSLLPAFAAVATPTF